MQQLPPENLANVCLEADIDAGNRAECEAVCSKFECCKREF